MSKYSSSSLTIKVLGSLNQYFLKSYTSKVFRVLASWYRYSKINQIIAKFFKRSSSLKHSTTCRICSKVFFSIDRLWDRLSTFAVKSREDSYVISFIQKNFCRISSSIAYSLFVLFFSCGFGVTSILTGTFNNTKAILLVLGFLVATLFLVGREGWTAYLKGSLFWNIVLYVFD